MALWGSGRLWGSGVAWGGSAPTQTVDQLRPRSDAQWELMLLIDGFPYGYVSHRFLEAQPTTDGRTLRRGLSREGLRRALKTDLRRPGMHSPRMRFRIHDYAGDLAELLKANVDADNDTTLLTSIEPYDDLSGSPEFHGKHIGVEAIGPNGERHRYPAPLDWDVGFFHYGGGQDEDTLDLRPAPVSDTPVVWKGRRACLYRWYRDHVAYPTSYAHGWLAYDDAELIWWGTLVDDGEVNGRDWSIEADGPQSWLQKDLGLLSQTEPVPVYPRIALSDDENKIGICLSAVDGGTNNRETYGVDQYTTTITSDTPAEMWAELQTAVTAAKAASGTDGAWDDLTDTGTAWLLSLSSNREVSIRAPNNGMGSNTNPWANCYISVHKKVWALWGYAIADQLSRMETEVITSDDRGVYFWPHDTGPGAARLGAAPNADYVIANFHTVGVGLDPSEDPDYWHSNSQTRVWKPRYAGGTMYLDPSEIQSIGQPASLGGPSGEPVAHWGQIDRPPKSDPHDPSAPYQTTAASVDRQGLFVVWGKRRDEGSDDEYDEQWVLRASWRAGSLAQNGMIVDGQVVFHEVMLPWLLGYDRPLPTRLWLQQQGKVYAQPLYLIGYNAGNWHDSAVVLLQRILRTTGTSTGWWADYPTNTDPGYSDETPHLDPGVNETILQGFVRLDSEIATLGLGIPGSMLATPADFNAVAQKVDNIDQLEVKLAIAPGMNAEDIMHGLMQPLGWCWSLRGGQYGVFAPMDEIEEADVEVVFDRSNRVEDYHLGDREPLRQRIRELAPIDRFDLEYSQTPYEDSYLHKWSYQASDRSRAYRPGGIPYRITAMAHRHLRGARERFDKMAAFWAKRHMAIEQHPVMPTTVRSCWPGTIGRFSDAQGVDPDGVYGIANRRCFVVGVDEDLSRRPQPPTVDLFILGDKNEVPRVHCFSARGKGWDSATGEILVYDNWLSIPSTGVWVDSAQFVEPSYVGRLPFGGNARIKWAQWDGNTWSFTGGGVVSTVNTTPGSCSVTVTSVTGTYYAYQDAILMPDDFTAQDAAWCLALFGAIGDDQGVIGAGTIRPKWKELTD